MIYNKISSSANAYYYILNIFYNQGLKILQKRLVKLHIYVFFSVVGGGVA